MSSISYLRTKPIWLLSALFIPALLCGISVGISMLLGTRSFKFPLSDESWRVWPYLLGSFLISLFVVTVGEETGWRGYLLPELQSRFSPLISTLILGLIWGLWHSPLYFIGLYDFPGNRLVNALMYIPFAIAFSFQFTWIFNRTGGVLSLALLLHASCNTTLKMLPGSPWLLPAMAVFTIFLIIRDKMWKRVNADMT